MTRMTGSGVIMLELENMSVKVAGVGYVNTVPDEKVTRVLD